MKNRRIAIQLRPVSMTHVLCLIFLFLYIFLYSYPAVAEHLVHVRKGDQWHYYKGTAQLPRHWTYVNFDDSGWNIGKTGLGYGHGNEGTELHDMQGNYAGVCARRKFTIKKTKHIRRAILHLECDGPFVAYMNGIEVLRSDTGIRAQNFDLSGFGHEMIPGNNVLSIQCSNDDMNSENFSFVPQFRVYGQ